VISTLGGAGAVICTRVGAATVTFCVVVAAGPPLQLTVWPVNVFVVEQPA
jgi:hypothetical protein